MQFARPATLALALTLALTAPLAAQSERKPIKRSDLVSSVQLEQSGGLKIDIPDLGTVVLKSVKSPRGTECFLHVPSVRQALIERRFNATGIKAEVWLDFFVDERPEGNVPICAGGGDQCRIEVDLPED